nr:restriction endonuclease subunit S [Clostridium sp. cel8]
MTELGEIPEEWKVKKLGEKVEIRSGNSPSKFNLHDYGSFPFYKVDDMNYTEKYLNKSKAYFDEEKYNLMPKGMIVFPKRGASIFTNKVAILQNAGYFDTNIMGLKCKDGLNNEYLFYQLKFIELKKFADTTAVPQINNKHINPLKICLPPLKEQQKIASILSSVDEQIEITDSLIEKTKELKKGLMQRFLTKGIGHSRFKDTEIGRIPVEWEVRKLGKIFSINSKSIKPYKYDKEFLHYSIPAYDEARTPIIQNGKEIRSNKFIIEKDSILVSKLNPRIKRVWKVTYSKKNIQVCSTEFINYVPLYKNIIDISYYYQYFLSDVFQNQLLLREKGTTGSRKRVSPNDTKDILVSLPALKEQQKIASILSSVDEQIDQYESKKEKLKELKKGLMQKLLTGKIRVKV